MSWLEFHTKSEQLSAAAEVVQREGDLERSRKLYAQAARAEAKAVENLDPSKVRTLGVSIVSAVALFYKAQAYVEAEQFAYSWLSKSSIPPFASEQLRSLLQTIWSDSIRAKSSIRFSKGEVLVSVKGGDVVEGGAPLDLIVRKVERIQALFYRTAEFLKGMPHRRHGPASAEIQRVCRPWLFQTVPGSYQFAVAIEDPTQQELFPTKELSSQEISTTFLRILRASVDDPDGALVQIVPDDNYRGTFLKLARNLAPSGQGFEQLEVRHAEEARPINIEVTTRKSISESLRRQFPKPKSVEVQEETITGILRAVHLDQDWLEVMVGTEHIRITDVGEAVDDVVGPMVNRQVIVQALLKPSKQRTLVDIQAAE